uniref:Uncharacterized protein n=1 Tax=Oryza glumipatula TaxID=40148 RepID=A0A0E0BJN0_9ORYZ
MELQLCCPLGPQFHRFHRLPHRSRIDNLIIRIRHRQPLGALPLRLQVAIIAVLGRWSNYLHMATDAVGPATSPSSSSSMSHRQHCRIFLDYTSLFSGNCGCCFGNSASTPFSLRNRLGGLLC